MFLCLHVDESQFYLLGFLFINLSISSQQVLHRSIDTLRHETSWVKWFFSSNNCDSDLKWNKAFIVVQRKHWSEDGLIILINICFFFSPPTGKKEKKDLVCETALPRCFTPSHPREFHHLQLGHKNSRPPISSRIRQLESRALRFPGESYRYLLASAAEW